MANNKESEKTFRQFEVEILDQHHKTLSLWNRDRNVATFAALAQFDCLSAILSSSFLPINNSLSAIQKVKSTEEGLSQAIRWLHEGDTQFDLTPTGDAKIIEEAGGFCQFAGKYVDIADFHKMYGRNLVEIEVNNEARTVRFSTPKNTHPAESMLGMAEHSHRAGKIFSKEPSSELEELVHFMNNSVSTAKYQYDSGHIVLENLSMVNEVKFHELLKYGIPEEPIPLNSDEDLVGFSAGEFKKFFEAFQSWSFCCTLGFLISVTQRDKQQWECAPTQSVPRNQFVQSMASLTGLLNTTVEKIVCRLTYDRRTQCPDVYQQPLFCGDNFVTWSTSVVQNSKYMRNMLKLMSRTSQLQDHTATLIGNREGKMLCQLGDTFSRKGKTAYKLNTTVSCGGEEGEIDLLAYNQKFPYEVLIVEGKAMLGVDEINEVDAATEEMLEGQNQLARVKRILARMPDEEKQQLFKFVRWNLVENIYCVVIAADAEPNDKFDHSRYPGISLQTVISRLRDKHYASPQKFWRACSERRWMKKFREYTESHVPYKVGNVTYEMPVFIEPEKQIDDDSKE